MSRLPSASPPPRRDNLMPVSRNRRMVFKSEISQLAATHQRGAPRRSGLECVNRFCREVSDEFFVSISISFKLKVCSSNGPSRGVFCGLICNLSGCEDSTENVVQFSDSASVRQQFYAIFQRRWRLNSGVTSLRSFLKQSQPAHPKNCS